MRAYLELSKRAFINSITYRSELFLWLILDSIPFIVLLFVWVAIYQGRSEISTYGLAEISQYYWIVLIINSLTSSHFESYRVQQIRDGKIDFYLIRPLSYMAEIFFVFIGNKLFYFVGSLPFFLIVYTILSQYLDLGIFAPSPENLLIFSVLLLAGLLIEFFFGLIIVLLGFWFEYSEGLEHFKWISVSLFSGSLFPVALMPQWLATITQALPFKYMYAVPIGVVQGKLSLTLSDVVYVLMFLGGLLAISLITWHYAKKQYSSAGG